MTPTTTRRSAAVRPPPMILGWRERVALPGLRVPSLKAKLDTGARTSSLHVTDVDPFRRRGADWVRFHVVRDVGGRRPHVFAEAPVVDERTVRSSAGHEDDRYVIETAIEVAGHRWPIHLTLAERPSMVFRMLLGRQALSGRVLVDPARSYLAGRPLPRSKRGAR